MKKFILFAIFVLVSVSFTQAVLSDRNFLAALFLPESITAEQLREKYDKKALRILIVPGHDQEAWGTQFNGVREVDLNIEVAEYLSQFLRGNDRFEVFLSQDRNGYAQIFSDYFFTKKDLINELREYVRQFKAWALTQGFEKRTGVYHNSVGEDVANKLYGINRWANDNGIDIVAHIHFNDYAPRRASRKGTYSGLSVYVPDKQLPNARASRAVAQAVFDELNKVLAVSDLPKENAGIVEDQNLIAVGAYGSLKPAALLVEYGYIYESPWTDEGIRSEFLRELAYRTYRGFLKFFNETTVGDTTLLPHNWESTLAENIRNSRDVLALQAALIQEGLYPPVDLGIQKCPLTGNFLECTRSAVSAFQEKYNADILAPAGLLAPTGIAGPLTLKKLNDLYGY